MATLTHEILNETTAGFTQGIKYFAAEAQTYEQYTRSAVIGESEKAIAAIDDQAVYQTQLAAADALRYLALQVCSSKESGHPGGFASSADAYAALVMLGHTNITTSILCFRAMQI